MASGAAQTRNCTYNSNTRDLAGTSRGEFHEDDRRKETTGLRKKSARPRRDGRGRVWTLRRNGGLEILEASPLARLDWLVHGFSTRPGGSSEIETPPEGPPGNKEKVLNLGFTDWDLRERVLENRRKFVPRTRRRKMLGVTLRQIHSDLVHRVDRSAFDQREAPKADALITQRARRAARGADRRLHSDSSGGHEKSRGCGDPFRLARHAAAHRRKNARADADGFRHPARGCDRRDRPRNRPLLL